MPKTTRATVLMMMKIRPVKTEGDRTTLVSALPVAMAKEEKPRLNPIKMLKTGPAKHAVFVGRKNEKELM